MQIAKKQLFGFGGLALVIAMTAFATTLPTGAKSAEGNVDIYVEVEGPTFETNIRKPLDGAVYGVSNIEFSEHHSHVWVVKYYIERLTTGDKVAETFELTEHQVRGNDLSGTTTFSLDMNDYGGVGKYRFRSEAFWSDGSPRQSFVQFTYAAISATDESITSSSKEKVEFNVGYSAGVRSITYQLFDNENHEISDTFVTNTANYNDGGEVGLAIGDLNLSDGLYHIRLVGYAGSNATKNELNSLIISFRIGSTPSDDDTPNVPDTSGDDAPNVPDTGSIFSALNISRADYLLTGLIGFVAISVIALVVIRKSRKSQK